MSADAGRELERWVRSIAAWGFSSPEVGASPALAKELCSVAYGRIRGERLEGLLLAAWHAGAIELTTQELDAYSRAHREDMEQVLRLERTALDVSAALDRRGIRSVFLKGVALANTVYSDPALRSFGDVDVLVERSQFVSAIKALVGDGAVRGLPEVRPGFDARFAKDVPLVIDATTVDLHRTLIQGPFGPRIPTDELVAGSRPIELGGQRIRVLAPADAYVLAGLTAGAADAPARLITLRDLLELERMAEFNPDAVREAARRWDVEAALAGAIRAVTDQLRPEAPPALLDWSRSYRPTRLDRMFMGCYTSSARSYRSTLATLVAIPRWADRVGLLHALLRPQRTYREARGWTLADHLRRGVRKLLR